MEQKRKEPFALKMIKWGLPKLEYFSPKKAHKVYINLFFSPMRSKYLPFEQDKIDQAETFEYTYKGKNIKCYKWGKGSRKILFVHGWAGRAGQGVPFVDDFIRKDCTFYAVDLPAHGFSTSKQTNIIECAAVLKVINEGIGHIDLAIGHSFGGVVLTYGMKQNLNIDKWAMIGTPHDIQFVLNEFQRNVGASNEAIRALKKYAEINLNMTWDQINPIEQYANFDPSRILIIHDEQDKEIPFHLASKIEQKYPNIELIKTQNLGHKRILKNVEVIEKCLAFV